MILENTGLVGATSELGYLDAESERALFVRGGWDYDRATYDSKIVLDGETYYLRVFARATEGKLEQPDAILTVENVYIGRWIFPHGMDYETEIPNKVMGEANKRLAVLKDALV